MTSEEAKEVIAARLSELFARFAEQPAVELAIGDDREWSTWGQLGGLHEALAETLAAAGVPEGATIAVVMRQRPAMVAVELSVLAQGRTALLVTPLQPDGSLAADIGGVPSGVVVAHDVDWARPGFAAAVAGRGALGVGVDDGFTMTLRRAVSPLPTVEPLDDAAVTVQTSGTTGPPKRMPVRWADFVDLGGGPRGRPPGAGAGTLILSLPLVTLGGLLTITRLVFGGRPMAVMERFDVHTWAGLVREHRPQIIGAPPPVVKMILDADISPDNFEGVTAYMTSSAPVAPAVAAEFHRRYGIPVLLGYGATEFLASVTGWTVELWERFGATKLGSVGRARPGVRLRVLDPQTLADDEPVEAPVDTEGILEVDPPKRAAQLPAGWLRTADRARLDADGFLWILGRADDVIVRGGFKVDLQRVEAALVEHPAVVAACAVGLDDERLGSVPAAIVTASALVTEEELLAWTRDRVPPYAVPVQVRVVAEIPLTSTLKPHRAEVRRQLAQS